MHIKIFFDDKPLFLCDEIDEIVQPYLHHEDSVYIDELNAHTVKTMIHEMQQAQVHAGVFCFRDLTKLKDDIQKKFTLVRAAGGLVINEAHEILMIFRRGKWDLPKGKLDNDEKLEDCALREVEEETGLINVQLQSPLTVTYHTYHEGSKYILKESHWFGMRVAGKQTLIPQTEEDILEIRWVERDSIRSFLSKSFPLISDVMEAARQQEIIAF